MVSLCLDLLTASLYLCTMVKVCGRRSLYPTSQSSCSPQLGSNLLNFLERVLRYSEVVCPVPRSLWSDMCFPRSTLPAPLLTVGVVALRPSSTWPLKSPAMTIVVLALTDAKRNTMCVHGRDKTHQGRECSKTSSKEIVCTGLDNNSS